MVLLFLQWVTGTISAIHDFNFKTRISHCLADLERDRGFRWTMIDVSRERPIPYTWRQAWIRPADGGESSALMAGATVGK